MQAQRSTRGAKGSALAGAGWATVAATVEEEMLPRAAGSVRHITADSAGELEGTPAPERLIPGDA